MKKRSIYTFVIIITALCTASFRWPVENGRITSTFGESRGDHFHDGIDLISPGNKIYSIDRGGLIFYWDKAIFPLENYPGAGNYRIVKHKDDLFSIYMHLEDSGPVNKMNSPDDVLAFVGNTGHSYGKHLHLALLHRNNKTSNNPLAIMPKIDDIKAPEVLNMYLKIGMQYVRIRDKSGIRLTQHYPLLLEIQDAIVGSEKLGIYRLVVQLNSKKVLEINFNSIAFSKKGLLVSHKPFDAIYDEKGYYKVDGIKYLEGENTLFVIAYDYAGNASEKNFSFTVDLDVKESN